MGRKQSFLISGLCFATKEELREYIRQKIAAYEDTEPFTQEDFIFFFDLLDLHPSADIKRGVGIQEFYADHNPVYKQQRCLYLRRIDGSVTDWSWTECLQPTPHPKKVRQAFRALLEPEMIRLKQIFFDEHNGSALCPIAHTPITFTTAHVDHIPPQTFEALFLSFIREHQVDISSLLLSSEGKDNVYQNTLADDALAQQWLIYHAKHARLRVISGRANLSHVKRGIAA